MEISGILLTMVDCRTNNARDIEEEIRTAYGRRIPVFKTTIPRSVRVAETSIEGTSIYAYDPNGKATEAYHALTKEVLRNEAQRQKAKSDLVR